MLYIWQVGEAFSFVRMECSEVPVNGDGDGDEMKTTEIVL